MTTRRKTRRLSRDEQRQLDGYARRHWRELVVRDKTFDELAAEYSALVGYPVSPSSYKEAMKRCGLNTRQGYRFPKDRPAPRPAVRTIADDAADAVAAAEDWHPPAPTNGSPYSHDPSGIVETLALRGRVKDLEAKLAKANATIANLKTAIAAICE